ncbi:hypothetical protein HF325_002544 [Metschnikowia pulcherrima]|uniref:Uncharacterized protein n=1 Tax=Metschnikowia pulcherrima TaxID=27326 RepID=A0A8H7LCE6_9ASCO|nr:hypothetical protein HF325_002544 [Metschnikowia pulcherrima]
MILDVVGRQRKLLASMALLACMAFTIMSFLYQDSISLMPEHMRKIEENERETSLESKVVLPAGFHFPKNALKDHLFGTSGEFWETVQLKASEVKHMPPLELGNMTPSNVYIYEASKEEECERKEQKTTFFTDKSKHLSTNLHKTMENAMDEDKLDTHWFRFAGSSVWLKDYNVHFVVSRLIITENGNRENPRLSMVYAQIYDEKWSEIEDIRLVFPTNNVEGDSGFRVNGQSFILHRFPRFLPIPFLFGENGLYWGAEDPRVTLVTNPLGHVEPLIVQKGKRLFLADTEETKEQWFTRTKQVIIEGEPMRRTEKNWTPFVSQAGDFSEHVMFATLLEPLKVIKCELWTDKEECSVEESRASGEVGALRGGTPLLSIRYDPEKDQEVFAGLARAHLIQCGCAVHFYRPNLVVLARNGRKWMLSHISSSVDLGMDVLPWYPGGGVCDAVNAMIPNGIESWDLENDIMSVYASVSDVTLERVHLHGVMNALKSMKYWEVEDDHRLFDPVECALEASDRFCNEYGIKHLERAKRLFAVFSENDTVANDQSFLVL